MRLPFAPDIGSLLEGIPHPAMILNNRFQIIMMNRLMEAITGHTREEVIDLYGELVVRSNTGNSRGQLYQKVMETGETVSVAGDILNCYRRKIPTQYTISILLDGQGEKAGLLVLAEDMSEHQQKSGAIRNYDSIELIGYSQKMQKVFDMIPLMAHTDATVLITGETGTGKDKIAEIIHHQSDRARFPFIKVNCGALPLDLLESELFGHVKGAFTGATRNKPGMFKLADKGTLFLTEIGDMPLPLQVKLLTVLDDRCFVPVGGEEKIEVDVRIMAATHRPLLEQVRENQFRQDLFYRLNVLHAHLPPLREREGDVRYLLDHFLQKFTQALGKTIVGFAPNAMESLLQYQYPGNVRELSNIVEYSVNICKKKKITRDILPPYLFEDVHRTGPENLLTNNARDPAIVEPPAEAAKTLPSQADYTGQSWEDIERQMIVDTLKRSGGVRIQAAEALGWGRMKLWRKMKKYNLI